MSRRGFSLVKTIIGLVSVLSLTAMAAHVVLSWMPRSVSAVESNEADPVDLKLRLEKAVKEEYPIEITEAELNQYFAEKLLLTQSPIVDDYVKIEGVSVELNKDLIDITIERTFDYPNNLQEDGSKKLSFMPLAQTVTMQLKVRSEATADGAVKTVVEFPGGHFGQAPAPGMLVTLIKPSFDVIAEFFKEELDLAYHQMTYVSVDEGVIKLDPRPLNSEQQ